MRIFTILNSNKNMKSFFFTFFCFLSVLNFAQNTQVSVGNSFEGEPYLTINPQNLQHLIAAWMGFQFGNKVVIKSTVSTNGGLTWTTPIWQLNLVPTNTSADVSVKFDNLGNVIDNGILKSQIYDCQKYKNGYYFLKL